MNRLFSVLVLGILIFAAACSGGSTTEPTVSIVGEYSLGKVNGFSLPATLEETSTSKVEVVSGLLRVESNESFAMQIRFRVTSSGGGPAELVEEMRGKWRMSGKTLTFSGEGFGGVSGQVSTDTITLNMDASTVFLFNK